MKKIKSPDESECEKLLENAPTEKVNYEIDKEGLRDFISTVQLFALFFSSVGIAYITYLFLYIFPSIVDEISLFLKIS